MKKILLCTTALFAMLALSPVLADEHGHWRHRTTANDNDRDHGGTRERGRHGTNSSNEARDRKGHDRHNGSNSDMLQVRDRDNTNRGTRHRDRDVTPNDTNDGRHRSPSRGSAASDHHNRWHGGRHHNSNFDRMRRVFKAPHRYRFGSYHRPHGWYRHRWTFGDFLPRIFFAPNYWITDYYAFGLDYPPPGTIWVRYGDDALLIDRYTGEVIEVVYGIFY